MKFTKINTSLANSLKQVLQKYPPVRKIVKAIAKAGGRSLLVGGAVRDLFLKLPIKDLDIEVHGLSVAQLETVLKNFGHVSKVGKAFGVLRLHGLDIDWSLPRADSPGRKPKVKIDPHMNFKNAFKRRDLTMNAMGIDLLTNQLIDPFGGRNDLKEKRLHAPDVTFFVEDPLRLFRVMQFIGRFEMVPSMQLQKLCKKMNLSGISRERIEDEFEKLLLKSKRPSLGIRWLQKTKRLEELLPELYATVGTPQNKKWHPEGDVFEHTMQAIDAAAQFDYDDNQQKLIMLYAALCHDLGKATTTTKTKGQIKSIGHEKASERYAKKMLKRVTGKKNIIKAVQKLVKYHMVPAQFVDIDAKSSAYKRLARKLAPEVTLHMLGQLAIADKQGRNPKKGKPLRKNIPEIKTFLKRAHKARVEKKPEAPILLGRDLMDVIKPGPQMGKLVKRAYEIQIEKGIKDKDELKRRVLKK